MSPTFSKCIFLFLLPPFIILFTEREKEDEEVEYDDDGDEDFEEEEEVFRRTSSTVSYKRELFKTY